MLISNANHHSATQLTPTQHSIFQLQLHTITSQFSLLIRSRFFQKGKFIIIHTHSEHAVLIIGLFIYVHFSVTMTTTTTMMNPNENEEGWAEWIKGKRECKGLCDAAHHDDDWRMNEGGSTMHHPEMLLLSHIYPKFIIAQHLHSQVCIQISHYARERERQHSLQFGSFISLEFWKRTITHIHPQNPFQIIDTMYAE